MNCPTPPSYIEYSMDASQSTINIQRQMCRHNYYLYDDIEKKIIPGGNFRCRLLNCDPRPQMVVHVDKPTILCHSHPGVPWRWLYMWISPQYYVTPIQGTHGDGCTCRSAHNIMSPPPRGPMEMVVHADQHKILCHPHPGVPWRWLHM